MSALGDIVHALPVFAALGATRPDVGGRLAGRSEVRSHSRVRCRTQPAHHRSARFVRRGDGNARAWLRRRDRLAGLAQVGGDGTTVRRQARDWLRTGGTARRGGCVVLQRTGERHAGRARHLEEPVSAALARDRAPREITFPFVVPASAVADGVSREATAGAARGFALINPGAAWPNKRWPPDRFGAIARHVARCAQPRVHCVVGRRRGASRRCGGGRRRRRRHARAATRPSAICWRSVAACAVDGFRRHGPPAHCCRDAHADRRHLRSDVARTERTMGSQRRRRLTRRGCVCHHKRRCQRSGPMCINDITVEEVAVAVSRRLGLAREATP